MRVAVNREVRPALVFTVPVLLAAAVTGSLAAQAPAESTVAITAAATAASAPPATLTYANRPIVEFRASFLGRPPAERVAAAHVALDRLLDAGLTSPVDSRTVGPLMVVQVAGHDVFALLPSDVDGLSGLTLSEVAAATTARLQTALSEA